MNTNTTETSRVVLGGTPIGDTGAIYHTFTFGDILISVLLVCIIILLFANLRRSK